MLSFSSAYTAQATGKNIVTDWLLELSYDDTTPGTFYFSGFDRRLTNYYHPLVMDWGTIDESIDLAKSQNSISDVTIELVNKWPNESGLLSAELFGGSKKFINQDVVIKSWIDGVTYANCPTVYKGRLVDIQHTQETVTLSIEKRSPWDRIKIPSTRVSTYNILAPLAYGAFSGNSSDDFPTSKAMFPSQDMIAVGDVLASFRNPEGQGYVSTAPAPFYYDKGLDEFLYVTASDSFLVGGNRAAITGLDLSRGAKIRPSLVNEDNVFTNPTNAFDGTASEATANSNASDGGDPGGSNAQVIVDGLLLDFPTAEGYYTTIIISYTYDITINTLTGDSGSVVLEDYTLGTDRTIASRSSVGTTSGTNTVNITADYSGTPPSAISMKVTSSVETAGSGAIEIDADIGISDVHVVFSTGLDTTNEPLASSAVIKSTGNLYLSQVGPLQGWADGSGTASYPHDIYRDMLYRFAGWDAPEEDSVAVNDSSWSESDIDTVRAWPCRWWTTEQVSLIDVLTKLQFEGAFIWIFDESTSGVEARVIYVKGSYSSTDLDLDYDNIANIKVSTTPFSEIVTKRTFNFQRHPADDKRYIQTAYTENANRDDYNLAAEENAIEQDLDFMTDETDVYELLDYYDNIVGEPKVLVQCDILKPSDRALQVGDIVQFNNMAYEPYGKAWASIYFMCVKTQIAPNKFTATFREVG